MEWHMAHKTNRLHFSPYLYKVEKTTQHDEHLLQDAEIFDKQQLTLVQVGEVRVHANRVHLGGDQILLTRNKKSYFKKIFQTFHYKNGYIHFIEDFSDLSARKELVIQRFYVVGQISLVKL
jgi:hypothetical protein